MKIHIISILHNCKYKMADDQSHSYDAMVRMSFLQLVQTIYNLHLILMNDYLTSHTQACNGDTTNWLFQLLQNKLVEL
jgi:hypothetical protein